MAGKNSRTSAKGKNKLTTTTKRRRYSKESKVYAKELKYNGYTMTQIMKILEREFGLIFPNTTLVTWYKECHMFAYEKERTTTRSFRLVLTESHINSLFKPKEPTSHYKSLGPPNSFPIMILNAPEKLKIAKEVYAITRDIQETQRRLKKEHNMDIPYSILTMWTSDELEDEIAYTTEDEEQ